MGSGVDAECEARLILESAGFGLDEAPGAWRILSAMDGVRVERRPRRAMLGAEGECCRVRDEYRIYIAKDLSPARASFVALHELAHVHLDQLRHGDAEVEQLCDMIASCLLCPRVPFRQAVVEHGRQWEQLALDFGAEPVCVALRYLEVLDVPGVLLSPAGARVRGPEFAWGDVQRLARCRALPVGVARERVPDRLPRTLLTAAG